MDGLCPMTLKENCFDLNLIRPFLNGSKNSIYSYANFYKIKFREDPTNKNDIFFENKN